MHRNSALQREESQVSKKKLGAKFSLRCAEQHRGSTGAVPRPGVPEEDFPAGCMV